MVKDKIKKLSALEILDSRGIPTLRVTVSLENGISAKADVPSGTSAGAGEACELRDNDQKRYLGKGVLKAAENVAKLIFPKIKNRSVMNLAEIDKLMINLDGTENKSKLGGNAILGVSLACARAGSNCAKLPLYKYLRKLYKFPFNNFLIPRPMFNLVEGGLHAESGMDVQEFMFVPKTEKFAQALRYASETFHNLKELLLMRRLEANIGMEGGFSPKMSHSKEVVEIILQAIKRAKVPAENVGLALDVAASDLFDQAKDEHYIFKREKANFSREQLVSWYVELVRNYPIVSIEDGMAENDWTGWKNLYAKLGDKIRVVGDDLTVTNVKRLQKALERKAINAIVIKPNQIGTVTETVDTIKFAQKNKVALVVSHRSGDTNDTFIADLAVAVNAEFIKSGSVTRGERLAKYNRLLEIEKELQ